MTSKEFFRVREELQNEAKQALVKIGIPEPVAERMAGDLEAAIEALRPLDAETASGLAKRLREAESAARYAMLDDATELAREAAAAAEKLRALRERGARVEFPRSEQERERLERIGAYAQVFVETVGVRFKFAIRKGGKIELLSPKITKR